MNHAPLLPGATLGVMGGGQLARMWAQAAQSMGYRTVVLDPDPDSPAGLISHVHLQTAYLDPEGLASLAAQCQAVSTEFENVQIAELSYRCYELDHLKLLKDIFINFTEDMKFLRMKRTQEGQ